MQHFILGRTNLEISRTGFGALPIQRVSFEEASALLNRALDGGITYIDTARAYSDSEEKIGKAISHRRDEFILATKTGAMTAEGLEKGLNTGVQVAVKASEAPKCERCWAHDEHVGEDPDHPGLCPRCASLFA